MLQGRSFYLEFILLASFKSFVQCGLSLRGVFTDVRAVEPVPFFTSCSYDKLSSLCLARLTMCLHHFQYVGRKARPGEGCLQPGQQPPVPAGGPVPTGGCCRLGPAQQAHHRQGAALLRFLSAEV